MTPEKANTTPVNMTLKKNIIGNMTTSTKLSRTVPNSCPVKKLRIFHISFISRVITPVDERSKKSSGRLSTLSNINADKLASTRAVT